MNKTMIFNWTVKKVVVEGMWIGWDMNVEIPHPDDASLIGDLLSIVFIEAEKEFYLAFKGSPAFYIGCDLLGVSHSLV